MTPALFDVPATADPPAFKPVCGGKRFIEPPSRDQCWLRPKCIDDMVAADDPVRVYDAIGDMLDVSAIERHYAGGGAPAHYPRFMVKLLIFALCNGVRSGRAMAEHCKWDTRFIWLACGERLDHELFSDFRTRFGAELKLLFKQTVQMGVVSGLLSLQQISIDGTKIAAHAARKSLDLDGLDKALQSLDARIDELLAEAAGLDAEEDAREILEAAERERAAQIAQELATAQQRRDKLEAAKAALEANGQERINPTDIEAPIQKTQDGKRAGFNGQIAVDADSGMIVGQELTTAQNDTGQLAPIVEQAIENTGFKPEVAAADTGYQSAASLEYLETAEVNGYVKQPKTTQEGCFGYDDFVYDEERDLYTCPEGHELPYKGTKDLRYECRVYRASRKCCNGCPQRAKCLSGKAKSRQLVVAPHGELVSAMRRKVDTDEGQAALKRRSATVEPTFGTMKSVLGLRQFLLVGHEKAAIEFTLASIAINVRKLVSWAMSGGELCLLNGGQAQTPETATAGA